MIDSDLGPPNTPAGAVNPKKVLLMGRAGAGKTSMRSIVFADYRARDTRRLTATTSVEHSHFRFLGNLVLSLWDCGGQDTFMENYFESQREHIFRHAEVLIYVIEVRLFLGRPVSLRDNRPSETAGVKVKELERDLLYFRNTAENLWRFAPQSSIVCLIHKLDLVSPHMRAGILENYEGELRNRASGLDLTVYGTSIWDESLFRAWSDIACSLVPNLQKLERHLREFCDITGADEVVLFEKSTFLVLGRATRVPLSDHHRFEKISNICKQFKLTCGKSRSNFSSLTVHIPSFTIFIERFTMNTYIMMVVSDKEIPLAAAFCNVDYARSQFEKLAESMQIGPTL